MVLTIGYLEQVFFYLQKRFPNIRHYLFWSERSKRIKANQNKINMVHIYRALFKMVKMQYKLSLGQRCYFKHLWEFSDREEQ